MLVRARVLEMVELGVLDRWMSVAFLLLMMGMKVKLVCYMCVFALLVFA